MGMIDRAGDDRMQRGEAWHQIMYANDLPSLRLLAGIRHRTQAMPRYFFDTSDGDKFVKDDKGCDLPDVVAARDAAQAALPDMARDRMPDGEARTFCALVRDEAGTVVYRVALSLIGEWTAGQKLR